MSICLEPTSSLPGSSASEEEDTVKVIEEVVIQAPENLGTKVENWSLEFKNEELLWIRPAAQLVEGEGKLSATLLKPFSSLKASC